MNLTTWIRKFETDGTSLCSWEHRCCGEWYLLFACKILRLLILLRFLWYSMLNVVLYSNEAANCIHQCRRMKDGWYNEKHRRPNRRHGMRTMNPSLYLNIIVTMSHFQNCPAVTCRWQWQISLQPKNHFPYINMENDYIYYNRDICKDVNRTPQIFNKVNDNCVVHFWSMEGLYTENLFWAEKGE